MNDEDWDSMDLSEEEWAKFRKAVENMEKGVSTPLPYILVGSDSYFVSEEDPSGPIYLSVLPNYGMNIETKEFRKFKLFKSYCILK